MDRTHGIWFIGSVAALVVTTLIYIPYSGRSAQGASGGNAFGLTYGSIGYAFMLFAGALGLRKKFSTWRVGRAQAWMRGHLWLGTLSFPLILFHAGFHFGHGLTRLLMWMFLVVFSSGIVGALLQHYVPRTITERVPRETIYEQIGSVRCQLVEEAKRLVDQVCATTEGELSSATTQQRAAAGAQLQAFFRQQMQPFLEQGGSQKRPLGDRLRSQGIFQQLKAQVPPNLHLAIDDLENICEEKRELDQQTRYHSILHGWLLVHIPLSYALLLLGAVHAVVALRY